jgi:hypothetical protein
VKIRNISPRGALDVPLLGRVVEAGAVVEVTADQADRLLPQADNWEKAQTPMPHAAAASGPTRKGEAK